MAFLAADDEGRLSIFVSLELPPTDNHIYFNLPRGGRALTKDAKRFKLRVKEEVAKVAVMNPLSFRPHIPYAIKIVLFVEKLYNKGWPSKAQWRFNKIDGTNRTKLLIDSMAEAIGIDDRHIVTTTIQKEEDESRPRVEVTMEELYGRDTSW